MDAAAWLSVLGYVALAVILGGTVLRVLPLPRGSLLDDWSSCYLGGQVLLTAATISTGFVPLSHGHWLAGILAVLAAIHTVRSLRGEWPDWLLAAALGLAASAVAVALLFPNLVMVVHRTPVLDWDARSIWFFHGKALFYAGGLPPAFFTDPLYQWSSLDYPLLIPAQVAWSSFLAGGWSDVTARAFLLFNFVAYGRLLFVMLRRATFPWWLAVFAAGAFLVQGGYWYTHAFSYVAGSADNHYIAPLVLAMLALAAGGQRDRWGVSALLICYGACVKDEGTAYAALLAAALGIRALLGSWRRERAAGLRALLSNGRPLLVHAAVFAAPVLLWSVFKATHGIEGTLHLWQRLTTGGLFARSLVERAPTILGSMAEAYGLHHTPWLLLVLAGLVAASAVLGRLCRQDIGPRRGEVGIAVAFAIVNLMILCTYVLTPHDVEYHLRTSVARLLFFPHMMLFALCLLRLEVLVRVLAPLPSKGTTGNSAPLLLP